MISISSDPYGKDGHKQIKICVSGSADISFCGPDVVEKAKELGREIARQGAVLVTGATTGFPYWAAVGVKEEGGISIGFSPASSEKEHVEVYKLPIDYMDLIVYTGFGYPGRDLLLTRSSDAVMFGPGRVGTIHEFTIAFEDEKAIGIYEGGWDMSDELKYIIEKSHRQNDKVFFGKDVKALVSKVLETAKKLKVQ